MKKGEIIFWELDGVQVEKEKLEDLGLEKFISRNDYKTALIKALTETFKGNDRMYRRYNDKRGEVSFGVFLEHKGKTDINISKEFQFRLDKSTGEVSMLTEGETPEVVKDILERYSHEKKHLNSKQFTDIVKRYIKNKGYAVSMKKNGGVYFLDERFKEVKEHVKKVFDAVSGANLRSVAIHSEDESGAQALQDATKADVWSELSDIRDAIEKGYTEGTITHRQLKTKVAEADKVLEKIRVHENSLRTEATKLKVKTTSFSKKLSDLALKVEENIVQPEDFQAALEAL